MLHLLQNNFGGIRLICLLPLTPLNNDNWMLRTTQVWKFHKFIYCCFSGKAVQKWDLKNINSAICIQKSISRYSLTEYPIKTC